MKDFLITILEKLSPDYVFSEGSAVYKILVKPILLIAREIRALVGFLWEDNPDDLGESLTIGVANLGISPGGIYRGKIKLYFSEGIPTISKADRFYDQNGVPIYPIEYGEISTIFQDSMGKYIEVQAEAASPITPGDLTIGNSDFTFSRGSIDTPFVYSEEFSKLALYEAVSKWGIDPVGIQNTLLSLGIDDYAFMRAGSHKYSSDKIINYSDAMDAYIYDSFLGKKKGDYSINPNAGYFFNGDSDNIDDFITSIMDLTATIEFTDDQYKAVWVPGDGNEWIIDLINLFSFLNEPSTQPSVNFPALDWTSGINGLPWGDFIRRVVRGFYDGNGNPWILIGSKSFAVGDQVTPDGLIPAFNSLIDQEVKKRMSGMLTDIFDALNISIRDDIIRRAIEENRAEALLDILRRNMR